jgi:hypothetical protein
VVMPNAHRPSGAGLAMPSLTTTGVVGIIFKIWFIIG